MHTYHPTAYIYPVVRACSSARQDLGVEGVSAVLMNLPLYLVFLNWWLSIGIGSDCILQRKFLDVLRSTEMVPVLCVLSILHIPVCLSTRWLAGNTKHLAEFNFGHHNMGTMLVLMEAHVEVIADDGTLMVNEDYMMDMFLTIADMVNPFNIYLQFMFTGKLSKPVGVCKSVDNKVLLYHELHAELFEKIMILNMGMRPW